MTQQEQQLHVHHHEFLASPIAKRISALLDKHEQNITTFMLVRSTDITNTTDQQIRHLAVQLQETKKIRTLIYDTDTFVSKTLA